MFNPLI